MLSHKVYFFIITSFISTQLHAQDVTFYYEEGSRLKNSGNFDEAAQVWIQGARVLSMRDIIDPRIGIDLIDLISLGNRAIRALRLTNITVDAFISNQQCHVKTLLNKIGCGRAESNRGAILADSVLKCSTYSRMNKL